MRKCEKCGTVMRADLRLKVNGGGYGMVVRVDEKQKAKIIRFPRSVESTGERDGQKSEGDAHKRRLDGKDVGQKHGKPGQNAEHDQLMNFIFRHEKRPPPA